MTEFVNRRKRTNSWLRMTGNAILFIHLIVPLLLIIDVLSANAGWGRSERAVVAFAGLWIAAGVVAWNFVRNRPGYRDIALRILTVVYAVLITAGVVEIVLQWRNPGPELYRPGAQWVQDHDPSITPGIEGPSVFSVSSLGLRGPDPTVHTELRIVAVGGSTTICTDLDDSEVWTQLLMDRLNRGLKPGTIWVGNAGVDGHSTVHHLALMRALPEIRNADVLLFLIGANDLGATLTAEGRATQRMLEEDARQFVRHRLGAEGIPLFRRSRIVQMIQSAFWRFRNQAGARLQTDQDFYIEMRRRRSEAPRIGTPSLESGISEYEKRIEALDSERSSLGLVSS